MTEQRSGEKSCPCSSSRAQDQHRPARKAQPCTAQLGGLSISTQPMRGPPPPPVLKAPQGTTKSHQDSEGQVSNITTVTPEPGKQPPHPQSRNHKSVQETSPLS